MIACLDKQPHPDSHFLLYAKGHYLKTNTRSDLIKIHTNRWGCNSINTWSATIDYLLQITFKFGNFSASEFSSFIMGINNTILDSGVYGDSVGNSIATMCLSVLENVRIRDSIGVLIKLSEPDPNILPTYNQKRKKASRTPAIYHNDDALTSWRENS